MTQLHLINDLGVILVQAVFWTSIAFVIATSTFWPWWRADFGWTIILKTLCLSAILLPGNLNILFGINVMTYAWRWEEIITFAGVAVTIAWRGVVIWLLQHRDPPAVKSAYHHTERISKNTIRGS